MYTFTLMYLRSYRSLGRSFKMQTIQTLKLFKTPERQTGIGRDQQATEQIIMGTTSVLWTKGRCSASCR